MIGVQIGKKVGTGHFGSVRLPSFLVIMLRKTLFIENLPKTVDGNSSNPIPTHNKRRCSAQALLTLASPSALSAHSRQTPKQIHCFIYLNHNRLDIKDPVKSILNTGKSAVASIHCNTVQTYPGPKTTTIIGI